MPLPPFLPGPPPGVTGRTHAQGGIVAGPRAAPLPLAGMTLLTVEDSRFASDAMRLMAQRSGARLRRAETMAQARRHLALYRPDAVIVDLGLPDGAGEDLIAEIAQAMTQRPAQSGLPPKVPDATGGSGACILLAISGDPSRRATAMAAGAQDFLAKPVATLAEFQRAILRHLPDAVETRPGTPASGGIHPDRQALHDDLAHAADLLAQCRPDCSPERRAYVLGFLRGLARISHDPALDFATRRAEGAQDGADNGLDRLIRAIADRLSRQPAPFAVPPPPPD